MKADPTILGKAISLGGVPHTVIGVLGDFNVEDLFSPPPQVWVPFQLDPESADHGHYFQSAGRLKDGVSLEQAQARLTASAADFRAKFKNAIGPNGAFSVAPVGDVLVRNVRQSLFVLAGAVGFVLLIACANVANLLLVRATGRKREIAIRAALGGSRGRIISQVLTESLVLSAIGGALGLAFGDRRHPRDAVDQHRRPAAHRPGGRARWRRLARARIHDRAVARHRRDLRIDPGAAKLEDRSDDDAEGDRRAVRHRLPPEQDPIDPGRGRSRPGADAADRIGAADSIRDRAGPRRARVSMRTTC